MKILKECFIVLLSAKSQKEDIERGMEAGANLYLTKPFSLSHLIQIVEEFEKTRHETLNVKIPKASNETAEHYKQLQGFDAERLHILEIMLGSQHKVLESIKRFVADFSNYFHDIKTLLANSEITQVKQVINCIR